MQIAVVPYTPNIDTEEIFDNNEMFGTLRTYYEDKGYEVHLFNQCKKDNIAYVFCFSFNWKIISLINSIDAYKVYFAFEPEVVVPFHAANKIRCLLQYFDVIMTHFDDLIDNQRIFKCDEIKKIEMNRQGNIRFEDKKLMCNISGYKFSRHPKEMYSERMKVITYFQKKYKDDFSFYGQGNWSRLGYCNYGGAVADKAETYHRFKYALSLENAREINGYVTEKIIDCFIAGIVPIYGGPSNIEKYISSDCYIDYFSFKSMDELTDYLYQMPRIEYQTYLDASKKFLESDKCYRWTKKNYLKNICKLDEFLQSERKEHIKGSYMKILIEYVKDICGKIYAMSISKGNEINRRIHNTKQRRNNV